MDDMKATVHRPSGNGIVLLSLSVSFMALSAVAVILRLISKLRPISRLQPIPKLQPISNKRLRKIQSALSINGGSKLTADDYWIMIALV